MGGISELLTDMLKITGGGVVAAGLTLTVNGWRQNDELRRTATALATRLVPLFDLYARTCASIRGKHLNDRYSGGYDPGPFEGHWVASLPDVPTLPVDDAGWRALSPILAAQVQSFHLMVHAGKETVFGTAEYGDAEDVSIEVERQASILGSEAYRIASSICETYAIPYPEMTWDYVLHFKEENARIDEYYERNRRMNAELFDGVKDNSAPNAQIEPDGSDAGVAGDANPLVEK